MFTIHTLQELTNDKNSIWFNTLDLSRLGIIGHSHGGAVALDFCQKNNLCKAGINMDGWTKTYNSTESFITPFLFMLSEHGYMPEMQLLFDNNQRITFKKITIENANHDSFTDGILLKWPLSLLSKRQATTARKNIRRDIIQFFNTYL